MEEQIPTWRREVHEIFHEARSELREIIAVIDQLLANQTDSTPHEPHRTIDFSERINQLKRQLDQRIQERPNEG